MSIFPCPLSPLLSSRRSPLRYSVSIAFFGLHCVLSSVSIAILSSSSIAIFGLYCDLRFRYTTNSFPTEASLNKQRADRKGSPTHSHKSNKRRGWNLCWFISTDTPFAHQRNEGAAPEQQSNNWVGSWWLLLLLLLLFRWCRWLQCGWLVVAVVVG